MDLEKFQSLTGITIPENKKAFYLAQIKRVQSKLETLLGFTLSPQSSLFTELGKAEGSCPNTPEPLHLTQPDAVRGIIKLFPYNQKDKFLHIDPFYDVYSIKLVKTKNNRQFVTYKTFEYWTKQYKNGGIGNYIEECPTCYCDCDCKNCLQLAVDADWVDFQEDQNLPDELLYLFADMVIFYTDDTRDIKSESVDGHSWSRDVRKAPEDTVESQLLLSKYAGPFGSVKKVPTI